MIFCMKLSWIVHQKWSIIRQDLLNKLSFDEQFMIISRKISFLQLIILTRHKNLWKNPLCKTGRMVSRAWYNICFKIQLGGLANSRDTHKMSCTFQGFCGTFRKKSHKPLYQKYEIFYFWVLLACDPVFLGKNILRTCITIAVERRDASFFWSNFCSNSELWQWSGRERLNLLSVARWWHLSLSL